LYEEALGLTREAHADHLEAMILINLGDTDALQSDLLAAQTHYEQALGIWRRRADAWGIGIALLNMGSMALRAGDLTRAREQFREGLLTSMELGDQARVADYLDAIGGLTAALDKWSLAARLLSASTALYHSLGIEQFPDHRGEHDHAVAATKASLGDEAFTAAWDAGQALLPEQAISEALSVTLGGASATNR
jgi:tetratricopeptide (TPR) repeat protein